MPYDDPDVTDPMEFVGHALPGEPGGLERMAEDMIDEYVRFGFDQARILTMFRDPFFGFTHAVWRAKGDAWCAALVGEVASRWRRPPVAAAKE